MSESERLVRFELLGQEYQFYTAASEAEMENILSLVREQVEGHAGSRKGTLPAGRVAVMACLNMASKYVQLKQEFEKYRSDNETRAAQLSEEIRNSLFTG
jgi:cell division protein ZapA